MKTRLISTITILLAATLALAEVDPVHLAKLTNALLSNDSHERITAIVTLKGMGPDAESALPTLRTALAREDNVKIKQLMLSAIIAIEKGLATDPPGPTDIAGHVQRVMQLTEQATHDTKTRRREQALRKLAKLGPIARPALKTLKDLQADKSPVKELAALTERQITNQLWFIPKDERVDKDDKLVEDAHKITTQITQTLWHLSLKLTDENYRIRIKAIRAVAKFGAAASSLKPTLERMQGSDKHATVRKLAKIAAKKIGEQVKITEKMRKDEEDAK